MLYFSCDQAGPYNILSFEYSMSVFICAKLDELKCMYTLQNTLNATLASATLVVTSSSTALM